MDDQQIVNDGTNHDDVNSEDHKTSAVNSLILEYYKKFGKKRDLEQFFSLSTAQSEIRDPSSLFWRKIKALSDSSDSGDKRSESSTELCKISIRCSVADNSSKLQKEASKVSDADSPPIITEVHEYRHSDNESVKSEDVHSLKSVDGTLDLSTNKPNSPTSSVTSQRRLEWDSLADVGYGNESDQKMSASSLSTLERLALQQQYCINDTQQSNLGLPTAHSTPFELNNGVNNRSKYKKDLSKKTTKISSKEVDFIEMTLPQIPETNQAINLNLTKHITFNVDKKGEVNVEKIAKNVSSSPEKVSVGTYIIPEVKLDKEIQTTLTKEKTQEHDNYRKNPVCVNLNSLKKKCRKKKLRKVKSKSRLSKEIKVLNKSIVKDRSGEQISAAESFEYMPGHIYNQTHISNINEGRRSIPKKDNKSSLETSTGHTTDSSKDKNSFSKDLEKSIDLLKITLKRGNADDEIKKKLIKEIVQRLLKTRYKDDDSSDFLSGLSFDSKKLDLGCTSTSSTSEGRGYKPKKSILRVEKFNSNLPSTSQSTPNLPSTIKCEVGKAHGTSITDSDQSKDAKTSSEELYQKYLKALKREQAYKEHLKIKEALFKQKLVGSDPKINQDVKSQNKIKDLMKDLVRNNYDDGSGDASKLEGGSLNNINFNQSNSIRKQKSHSVFTLSSGTSSQQKTNTKKTDIGTTTTRSSKNEHHYCCCPIHIHKVGVTDSSVQVNILSNNEMHPDFQHHKHKCSDKTITSANIENNIKRNEIKYVCLCKETNSQGVPDNILIYKCSRLDNDHKTENMLQQSPHCTNAKCSNKKVSQINHKVLETTSGREQNFPKQSLNIQESSSSKSSQTNLDLDVILRQKCSDKCGSFTSTGQDPLQIEINQKRKSPILKLKRVHEAIRWTQTDISINPKISDPSFSDISIIDKKDCAKLVSEQCKEVSLENIKTSSDEMTELITDSSSKGLNINSSTKLSPDDEYKKADKQIQSDIDIGNVNNIGNQCDLQKKLNYSIPIEGTNMTLKVSLGDRETPDVNTQSNLYKRPILKTTEALTHKPTTSRNPTCLLQECSVGVQSTENYILDEYYNQAAACASKACEEVLNRRGTESKSEMTTQIRILDKCHTYPKGDKSNLFKVLQHSNTDTRKLDKVSHVTFDELKINFANGSAIPINPKTENMNDSQKVTEDINLTSSSDKTAENCKESQSSKTISDSECQTKSKSSSTSREAEEINDPLIDLIQNITKRYSKKETEKSKRKKCFKEIITVLNYLLDTEESSDQRVSTENTEIINQREPQKKEFTDKAVQFSNSKKDIKLSDPTSSDLPTTSTDSTACHVLNKIKKECEKYHQKRCKSHHRKVEESSSTSMNCHHRREHCHCNGGYKCKQKQFEKNKKKCLAYNLIVQSDSLASEETICENKNRPLRNIIVKVPKKKYENMPLKEMCAKLDREVPHCSRVYRSKSLPNDSEVSSTEDMIRQTQTFTVREYLERNRPDFVEKCSQRQNCLKMINETSTNERAAKRKLLSMQVGQQQTLSGMSDAGLRVFAAQLGKQLRTKKLAPKFISERDMKKHSEKIYKTLPEVVNKKEQMKKECVKKTNLLLASIFKKNLQKKTLQGAVNLSNYSTIIKI
ncbi:uncharacterized protein LOC123712989 [Pieris brassicae]|uniref:ALMS motif domain-containing protein n=1 Tax=Pieris brassicae TaxID=7116 RepID=A0A9P0TPS7_PIEBR|nr:uncharacterized protein LOC123712989 [Pieris brassicae]CAH4033832.1 unnamed protein product [Pieris brassicae]